MVLNTPSVEEEPVPEPEIATEKDILTSDKCEQLYRAYL